jgi:DNA repair exonuclease SbcCD ATPase subunit
MNTLTRLLSCAAGVATLAALGIAISHGQTALGRAASEHQELASRQQQIEQLKSENQELSQLRAINRQVRELEKANQDLPKLRNDIRRFREQTAEAARLAAENERLALALKTASVTDAPTPPDFIPRAALVDAGLGTPEAAVQTYFSALIRGDILRWTICFQGSVFGPQNLSHVSAEDRAKQSQRMIEENTNFPGYRIADRKQISPTRVELDVQGSANGAIMPIQVDLNGGEWRIQQ